MHFSICTDPNNDILTKYCNGRTMKIIQPLARRCLLLLKIVLSLILVTSCGNPQASLDLCGLNYTDKLIDEFSVDGYSGANISPNGGGGKFTCCIIMPRVWRDGMTVTVRWTHDRSDPQYSMERVVPVPKYESEDLGFLAVHFYPNDLVKVLVTNKAETYPGYPYPRPSRSMR